MNSIKSVSLACRIVLDMHALNNEGSESNRLMTRQVGIVTAGEDENGGRGYQRATVNAISGDMNKHIFADAYRNIALDMGLPMNTASQALDPVRIMGDKAFREYVTNFAKDKSNKDSEHLIVDQLLTCALTDVCGIMITGSGQSIKRKSAIEFGWTVGLPEITSVQEFIHARHAVTRLTRTKPERGADQETKDAAESERTENTGQMIFNRPASSGVYAFVAHLDAAAIGFNDYRQEYPDAITHFETNEAIAIDRDARFRASLLALAQTVLHPKGALTSTQLPHVVDIEGFVSMSENAIAAPLISPLADDYIGQAEETANTLNSLYGADAVAVQQFSGGNGLLSELGKIAENNVAGRYLRV